MANTLYIKLKDGTYVKKKYKEKEVKGNLTLLEDLLPIGPEGPEGLKGDDGRDGKDGRQGIDGKDGKDGQHGRPGFHGMDGYTPIKGIDYFDGQTGEKGERGEKGEKGDVGERGEIGEIGLQGPIGLRGEKGEIGLQGLVGATGAGGVKGDKGDKGDRGLIGPEGPSGIAGATGATGARGLKGDKGERGLPGGSGGRGADGPAGQDGGSYQLRFVDTDKSIPAGYEQVAYDLFVIDTLTVEAETTTYTIGSYSVDNKALLNIKEDLWIDGTFNVLGQVIFDYKQQIRTYGAWHSQQTQTNAGATYANIMTLDSVDYESGIHLVGGSKIQFTQDGAYNIQFSAQVDKTDSGADEVEIWLRKNGQNVNSTSTTLELVGNNAEYVAAWNFVIEALKDEYVELVWHSNDIHMRLLQRGTASNPSRPDIPSLILTAQQI